MGLLAFVIAVAAILAIRFGDKFEEPFLVAEDGSIFFTQNLILGPQAIWTSYAGYLHVVPRLIAAVSGLFPIEKTATLFTSLSFLVLILTFVGVYKVLGGGARAWIPGLAMALLPEDLYLFLNPTNSQWFLGFLLCCFALGDYRPEKCSTQSLWLSATSIIGLTGPFSILVWPVFVLRFWALRDRWSFLILIGQSIAAIVQVSFLVRSTVSSNPEIENLWRWIGEFGAGVFLGMPAIEKALGGWQPLLGLAMLAGYFALIFVHVGRSPDREKRALRLAAPIAVIIFAAASLYRGGTEISPWGVGERYFMIPYLLVFLSLGDAAVSLGRLMRAVAAAGLVFAYLTFLSVPNPPVGGRGWEKQVDEIPPGGSGFVQVWPDSRNWEVFVAFAKDSRKPLRGEAYLRKLNKENSED